MCGYCDVTDNCLIFVQLELKGQPHDDGTVRVTDSETSAVTPPSTVNTSLQLESYVTSTNGCTVSTMKIKKSEGFCSEHIVFNKVITKMSSTAFSFPHIVFSPPHRGSCPQPAVFPLLNTLQSSITDNQDQFARTVPSQHGPMCMFSLCLYRVSLEVGPLPPLHASLKPPVSARVAHKAACSRFTLANRRSFG